MTDRELILKIHKNRIFFNPDVSIPLSETNIPEAHLTFRSSENIVWKAEMLAYEAEKKSLKIRVIDYQCEDESRFVSQQPKKPVEQLHFEKLDWQQLMPLLSHYEKGRFKELLINADETLKVKEDDEDDEDEEFLFSFSESDRKLSEKVAPIQAQVSSKTLELEFWVPFSEAQFRLGYVSFQRHIKEAGKELSFHIPNEHILAEFENIKTWFIKKLKTQKFKVAAKVVMKGDEILEILAQSVQINRITPELIEGVKYQRTFALKKELSVLNPDQSLFTADDMFSSMNSEDAEGNVFAQSEQDILDYFMNGQEIRNRKHLSFLASRQSTQYPLRFTLHPNFGFLFSLEGERNLHFVWELLNSHATYMWSLEKNQAALQFRRIQDVISTIRTQGREQYKRDYRHNHVDEDLVFRVINHEHIHSKLVDDFVRWKSKLNEQLT